MRSIKGFFTYIPTVTPLDFGLLGLLFCLALPASADSLQNHIPEISNPLLHEQLQVSVKQSLAVACNPHHRIASWVMFPLTSEDLIKKPRFKRISSNYPSDTSMLGECVVRTEEYKEYTKAGYDRGHLADAESFTGNSIANQEVAFTSNLAPQDSSFNRGIWAKLESWQRDQARNEGEIFVFVGPILNPNLPYLKAGLSIPEKYFKIIVDLTPPKKVIAYIIDQDDRGDFKQFWVCGDEVEKQTGLSFANQMLGADKAQLFSQCNINDWH